MVGYRASRLTQPTLRLLIAHERRCVMAGLVPAIHVFQDGRQDVDARHKLALGPAEGRTRVAGHDIGSYKN